VGTLTVYADDRGLVAIVWPGETPGRVPLSESVESSTDPVLRAAADQLDAYFSGTLRDFDLPLAPRGTDFQVRAWRALATVPYGETRSYAAQAASIGAPTAVRAVGAANGRNPLSIVLPCHRIVGSDGSLTGFAGGLDAKRFLLDHERRHAHGIDTLF
jgi:methylated-DNA-[protein]-cysteine S-methyltransferase